MRRHSLRDELLRRGETVVAGAAYSATITEAVRWPLDTKAIKAEMGIAGYDARCRQGLVTTVAVKPLAAPAALAA